MKPGGGNQSNKDMGRPDEKHLSRMYIQMYIPCFILLTVRQSPAPHTNRDKEGIKMIIMYLMCKMCGLALWLGLWAISLPIRILLLPFEVFRRPKRTAKEAAGDAFWDTMIVAGLFF